MFAVRAKFGRYGFFRTAAVALLLVVGLVWGAGASDKAEELSLATAVQRGLAHATSLVLAQFSIEEAEIALEEAIIGRLAGQPESTVQQAEADLAEARDGYIDALVQVALRVEEAYYAVIRAEESLEIQQRTMEQADRQLAVAQARYDAGLISRQELVQAELSHQQSVSSMERTQRQAADARRQLARLIGADEGTAFVLRDTFPFEPFAIALEDAIAEALATRSEVKRAERTLAQAELNLVQADNPYTAPVTLRKAEMAVRRAEIQLEEAKVQVIDGIRQQWYGLKDAEYNVTSTRQREQLALDNLAISEARFEAGMISLIDLLRDQASALEAQLAAAGAVWDYNLAKARFLRALGRTELPPLPQDIADYMATWED